MRIIKIEKSTEPEDIFDEAELEAELEKDYIYPAVLSKINGKYFVEFPDFDYEGACGRSDSDAIFKARQELAWLVARSYGMLPSPSDVDSIPTDGYESVILLSADMESLRER